MKLTAEQIKEVKAMGCLFNRGSGDKFSVRVITENGVLSAEQFQAVAEAANKYGNGNTALTTRLTLEIQGVSYENIPLLQECLKKAGLYTGGTGAKVRPVVACKGTTCIFGQIDTQAIAKQAHDLFYTGYGKVSLPHKFKIAVGGCPNNCVKPDLNDFGIVGQSQPAANEEICRGCKTCPVEQSCLMNAAKVENGKLHIDEEKCNACGKCIDTCHFKSVSRAKHGVRIVIGGKWGRVGRPGVPLKGIFSVEDALIILEKALLLYRREGYQRERFGDMVERIGHERVEEMLLQEDLLAQKETILAAPLKGPKPKG